MVDYTKDTGSSGEMMIRDTGSVVEFWINSHNSSTFIHELPWGYTVNGSTNNNREYDYSAGAGWEKLDSWTVTTDQTVTFRLFDTGTSGFGGPTTLSATINRAAPPNAPSTPNISNVTSTSVFVTFTDGANNGAAIDFRQIGRNTINNNSGSSGIVKVSSDGSTTITGLTPGKLYYFWAQTHNSKGYSPWSGGRSVTTLRVPDAPDPAIISSPTQTSVVASFTDNGNGGSTILERQILRNTTNTTTGATAVSYTGVTTITGLQPATTYYFWTRVRNSAGWSPYSPVVVQKTIAGAYYKVGDVWKEAVPYVKDGGVWKLARPWVLVAGVWKEGS